MTSRFNSDDSGCIEVVTRSWNTSIVTSNQQNATIGSMHSGEFGVIRCITVKDDDFKPGSSIGALYHERINGGCGFVDVAAVGNEVIYRKELDEESLVSYINNVKQRVNVPVGYVDAYYEFRDRPNISDACDVILANCYPFWEGCSAEYALIYMKDMYQEATKAAKGKKVIITETGWPSEGSSLGGAKPSYSNYLKYFINSQLWSKNENIDMFYFSSFDESWKVDAEGDVGAFWGLWDKLEKLKF